MCQVGNTSNWHAVYGGDAYEGFENERDADSAREICFISLSTRCRSEEAASYCRCQELNGVGGMSGRFPLNQSRVDFGTTIRGDYW